MAVIINASTSTGLVQSADTSGIIQFQSNGSTKATLNSSGFSYPGGVLQVVQGTTNTTTTVSANTYTDTTLSASITPTSSSSKILVLINQQSVVSVYAGPNGLGLRLLRGSTPIFDPSPLDGAGSPFLIYGTAVSGIFTTVSFSYLDSPATTSSTTYKTQGRPYDSSLSSSIFQNGVTKATSTITLLEIAA